VRTPRQICKKSSVISSAGTPSGEFFGVPHSGKSFKTLAIDIQTVEGGKIVKTYHLENSINALGQLRAK
jgi:predicted ester cyclase